MSETEQLLRQLAADALLMARNGDYHNGVADATGVLDEGAVKAGDVLRMLDAQADALGLVVKSTIYDNHEYYAPGGDE